MTALIAKIAVGLLEMHEQLMALPTAETLPVLTEAVKLFGFHYALRLTLTKEQ